MTPQTLTQTVSHDPGPFEYRREADGVDDQWVIYQPLDDRDIATIVFWDSDSEWMGRTEANARLLAAAPELLTTMKQMLDAIANLPSAALTIEVLEAEQNAQAIIDKAEGRSGGR